VQHREERIKKNEELNKIGSQCANSAFQKSKKNDARSKSRKGPSLEKKSSLKTWSKRKKNPDEPQEGRAAQKNRPVKKKKGGNYSATRKTGTTKKRGKSVLCSKMKRGKSATPKRTPCDPSLISTS